MAITISKAAHPTFFSSPYLDHKVFTFPGGEIGVKLDVENLRYRHAGGSHLIAARLQNAADFMELVMVTDALRRWDPCGVRLVLPYVPYGRQDRVCVPGESFSLKAFASLINGLDYESVTTFDPHSDVTAGVIDRLTVIDQTTIIGHFDAFNSRLQPNSGVRPVFVSPDAGANKKVATLAAHFGHPAFIRADKTRDLATGKLSGFKVYLDDPDQIRGAEVVIPDDLADGAGTFVGLAAELKRHGAARVVLYVTHGLFTKGFDHLWAGGIDSIYTTNTYRKDLPTNDPRLVVLDIESPLLFTL